MSKRIVIVSGGKVEDDFALSVLESYENEYIIAVDKGMEMNGIHLCQKSGGKSCIYIIKAKQEV